MAGDDPPPGDATESQAVGGSADLSLDTVFELLASRRRRFTVYSLLETPSGVMAFDDLVADVAALESDCLPDSEAGVRRETVATDLHYWHLPVLAEVGVLTYDERSEVVQFDGDPSLERWAERARAEEQSDVS